MFKYLKIILFLFALSLSENVNAKPVPPGAGDGEVAANILILVRTVLIPRSSEALSSRTASS